jgi:hypothetical protein
MVNREEAGQLVAVFVAAYFVASCMYEIWSN